MIYEVHLRDPYRVFRLEADSFYTNNDSIVFSGQDTALHAFRIEDLVSVTTPSAIQVVEVVTGMREGTRLPLTVDSNLVQDSMSRMHHAPSIRTQNQSSSHPLVGEARYVNPTIRIFDQTEQEMRNSWEEVRHTAALMETSDADAYRYTAVQRTPSPPLDARPEGQAIRLYDDARTMRTF